MMTKEKAIAIKPLLENEEFCKKILTAESDAAVCGIFRENGVEMTEEDVQEVATAIENANDAEGNELSEQDLENVAGGEILTMAIIYVCGVIIVCALAWVSLNHPEWLQFNSIAKGASKKNKKRK